MWMIMPVNFDSVLLARLCELHPILHKPYKTEEEALQAREDFLSEHKSDYLREHLKVRLI